MKIAGIIAEYNPFHNGHALHIAKTREKAGADHIICVMSGNFVQRGEPAIADKWVRARMALAGGADVVMELPFLYATQSAEGFAAGGVRLLEALNCVDILSFGSECGDLSPLARGAELLANEPPALSDKIKEELKTGQSFPRARGKAIEDLLGRSLQSPNDILAVEYLKALARYHGVMQPYTIKRSGADYADELMREDFSSAAAIRRSLAAGETVFGNIPAECVPFYGFEPLTDPDGYFRLLLYRLRGMDAKELSCICDVSEGLENRILQGARQAQTPDSLVAYVKSKRYAHTRVKRVLLYCLMGVTKKAVRHANAHGPAYARVLGLRRDKTGLLSHIVKRSALPVLTRPAEFFENASLDFDLYATDVYSLLHKKIAPAGRDFTEKLIVM